MAYLREIQKNVAQTYSDEVRKAKAWLELDLAKDVRKQEWLL